jgi:hypothetical protein
VIAGHGRNHGIPAPTRQLPKIDQQRLGASKSMGLHPSSLLKHRGRSSVHISRYAVEIGKERIRTEQLSDGRR